jgi:hypothetical protein
MHVSLLTLLVVGVVATIAIFAMPTASAKDAEATKGIAALAWLQGSWRSDGGHSTWEAAYTGPEGGEVVSASKEISGGKVVTYDFERFYEKDGKVIFSPYPHGKKSSHEFPLESLDAAAKKAVFANPANDFPSRFTYHRAADDRLVVTLEGKQGDKPMKFSIEFKRR